MLYTVQQHTRVRTMLLIAGVFMLVVVFATQHVSAAFNKEINYQGKLTDTSDAAVADDTYHMRFWLYDAETGGTAVWNGDRSSEQGNRVDVVNGLFSVMLGSSTPLTGVNFDQPLWLEVEIGGTASSGWETLSPRKRLGAVPAAFVADTVDGLEASQFLRSDEPDTMASTSASTLLTINQSGSGDILNILDGGNEVFTILDGGNLGIGTTSPYAKLSVVGPVVAEYFVATSTTATSTFSGDVVLDNDATLRLPDGALFSPVLTRDSDTSGFGMYFTDNGYGGTSCVNWGFEDSGPKTNKSAELCRAYDGIKFDFGTGYIAGNNGSNGTIFLGNDTYDTSFIFKLSTTNAIYVDDDTDTQISWDEGDELTISAGGVEGLKIDEDGGVANVLVNGGNLGVGTTSPYAKLSVVGETVSEYFSATNTAATSTFRGGLNVGSGGLVYDFSSGNVGIGNSAPHELLAVGDASGVGATIAINGGSDDVQGISFRITAAEQERAFVRLNGAEDLEIGTAETGDYLRLYSEGSEVARFRNGNVGIGTTSPLTRLTVGSTTPDSIASSNYYNSAFIGGDLEVDGTIYGTLNSASSIPLTQGYTLVGNGSNQASATSSLFVDATTGEIRADRVAIGDAASGSVDACVSYETASGKLYHDTNCNGIKGTGEFYIDGSEATTSLSGNFAPYNQYDPDAPPTVCNTTAYCEEFTNDAEDLVWRQGNEGTGVYSLTYSNSSAFMSVDSSGSTSNNALARWTTAAASGSSFTITMKWTGPEVTKYGMGGVIYVLQSGTEESPTEIVTLQYYGNGGGGSPLMRLSTLTSYTSGATVEASYGFGTIDQSTITELGTIYYTQLRYDHDTTTYSAYISLNGVDWYSIGTYNAGSDPTSSHGWGTYELGSTGGPNNSRARNFWWRERTDADRNFSGATPSGTAISTSTRLDQGHIFVGDVNNTAQATTSLYVQGNGNVGIGTTSPLTRLTVGSTTPDSIASSNYYNSAFIGGDLEVDGTIYGTLNSASSIPLTQGYTLVGNGSNQASATSSLFVDATGLIGIGTTTPQTTLHVDASAGSDSGFYLSDGNLSHTYAGLPGNVYGALTSIDSTNGGLLITGVGTDGSQDVVRIEGYSDSAQPIVFQRSDLDGSAPASNHVLFEFSDGTDVPLRISGKGKTVLSVTGVASGSEGAFEVDSTVTNVDTTDVGLFRGTNGGFIGDVLGLEQSRTLSSAFDFIDATADYDGTPVTAFRVRGDGQVYIADSLGIGTTSPYAKLSVAGQVVGEYFTGTSTATSTLGGGLDIATGCFAVNGVCTVNSGTAGQVAYYDANGTAVSGTSTIFIGTDQQVGIGNVSPNAKLYVQEGTTNTAALRLTEGGGGTTRLSFYTNLGAGALSSLTQTGDAGIFFDNSAQDTGSLVIAPWNSGGGGIRITNTGYVGIATSSPYERLSVAGGFVSEYVTAASSSATSTFSGGFNVGSGAIFYDVGANETSIENLNVGPIVFDTDAGSVAWIDLPVSSAPSAGTVESYSAQIDSQSILTVYGQTDGSGGLKNPRVLVGTSTDTVLGSSNIPYNSLIVANGIICVDDSAGSDCDNTARNTGGVYAEKGSLGGLDVAETYPTTDLDLEPGDIVMLDAENPLFVTRFDPSVAEDVRTPVLGIVSTKPGLLLGGFKQEALLEGHSQVPVALAGRVPVKISDENGVVQIGDRLTFSTTTPGVAVKASLGDESIAIALEPYDGSQSGMFAQDVITKGAATDIPGGLANDTATSTSSSNVVAEGPDTILAFVEHRAASPFAYIDLSELGVGGEEHQSVIQFVLSLFESLGIRLTAGAAWFQDVFANKIVVNNALTVGSSEHPTGVTLYDEITGEPYCLSMRDGEFVSTEGVCIGGKNEEPGPSATSTGTGAGGSDTGSDATSTDSTATSTNSDGDTESDPTATSTDPDPTATSTDPNPEPDIEPDATSIDPTPDPEPETELELESETELTIEPEPEAEPQLEPEPVEEISPEENPA